VPLSSGPAIGVPGLTGDVVADEPGAVELDDSAVEPAAETRFRSRYMADRDRREVEPAPLKRRTPDHRYVLGEIRRIAIFGALMIVILLAATLLLR
jgi:hypothetical protein